MDAASTLTQLQFHRLSQLAALLTLQVLSCWNSWLWYWQRMAASPQEGMVMFGLLILLLIALVKNLPAQSSRDPISFYPLTTLLLCYGIAHLLGAPALIRAALAILPILYTLYVAAFGRRPPLSFWSLAVLALPVLPSLQFYLGYPARLVSASLTVPLLNINGFDVQRQGTYLMWQGDMLQFDAPCSGITMLWGGWFLCSALAFGLRLNTWLTILALCLAPLLVLFANVLRASSLFYIEFNPAISLPAWSHEGVGAAAFVFVALPLAWTLHRSERWLHQ
ncbi:exosortase/archaeosortase family protein [Pseudomaricurvus alkylphenolicus]|uniref:archaeosortase/exosortase family protein n=1 Tax=Pseudomaricurvus alkylphenolicus TaxID=1306991 RepID=UPI00142485DF|nr:archaeosortase/exosortase family protein [Pseudomaricurvus alkylphenolicus]NIB41385.1 exosortase/archaeosortase family protein [Pseudomaricurvus alkylphenolicus]